MTNTYTAIIQPDGDWWIGWIEEIPGVNCQEASRDQLLETLKITLSEALELNKQGSSLLGMVRQGGINRLNPYLVRDLIDQFALDKKQLTKIAKCLSI